MTDYPDFATPAEQAAQIALAGVPLLSGLHPETNSPSITIPPGGIHLIPGVAFTQLGYEVFAEVEVNAAATQPGLQIELDWSESASGLQVAQERWQLLGSSAGAGQQYIGTGPSKGNELVVAVTNYDPAQSATLAWFLTQNSHVGIRDDWRQLTRLSVPGFATPETDAPAGWLCQANPSITSGNSAQRWIALYAGTVRLIAIGTQPFAVQINSFDPSLGLTPNLYPVYFNQVTGATGGFINDVIALPRTSCVATLTNTGSSTQAITLNMIAAEYAA